MSTIPALTGLHHVTAITSNASANHGFYTEVLGMRLVKRTVNQDDVSAWHLFYADGDGAPGTDLTFFAWPVGPERRGTRSISRTGLRVSQGSLDFWVNRLRDAGLHLGEVTEIAGHAGLDFEDPEGQRLRLVTVADAPINIWDKSPVPAAHQILGLGPVVISVPDLGPTEAVLTGVMGMTRLGEHASPDGEGRVHVFSMGEGGPQAQLHVAVQPGLPIARQGAGAVHHLAFRVPDTATLQDWAAHLDALRIPNSGEVERYYFRSIYFREPGGNLFEIATDGPGFDVDEPRETMGEALSLPPFLESRRAEIEAGLVPLG